MSLPQALATHTVTIVRDSEPQGYDNFGDPLPASEQRFTVTGCALQPLQGTASTETPGATGDLVVSRWVLYLEPGVDIRATDRVLQAADRVSPVEADEDAHLDLQVDGDPAEWMVTGTSLDHLEVYLKRWEGSSR